MARKRAVAFAHWVSRRLGSPFQGTDAAVLVKAYLGEGDGHVLARALRNRLSPREFGRTTFWLMAQEDMEVTFARDELRWTVDTGDEVVSTSTSTAGTKARRSTQCSPGSVGRARRAR